MEAHWGCVSRFHVILVAYEKPYSPVEFNPGYPMPTYFKGDRAIIIIIVKKTGVHYKHLKACICLEISN